MKTHLYLQKEGSKTLLLEVDLEVVPRGLYVVDGITYQCVGQPTFIIETYKVPGGVRLSGKPPTHTLTRAELTVEKVP